MISVAEAQTRIAAAFQPVEAEQVALVELAGRVLAGDLCAHTDQPPFAASSMDGYAVRKADSDAPRQLIGTAPAGHPFYGVVGPNQAVRIFTGAVIPSGADAIVIQENADIVDGHVQFDAFAIRPDLIRPAGLDFKQGSMLVPAGKRITARDIALLAAADIPRAAVRRRPRIAIASIGDELSTPGAPRRPGGIVASSGYGLAAMIAGWGGSINDLGILKDNAEEIASVADASADIVVTLGGVSVGDHDLVQKALGTRNFELDFWKVAMRPGKPLAFGRLGAMPVLGIPGNPVSALVCAILFLKPAIDAMLGVSPVTSLVRAKLRSPLAANDSRQSYVRAKLACIDGEYWVEPFGAQDSSMLSVLAQAGALIVRMPGAPAADPGSAVDIMPLNTD